MIQKICALILLTAALPLVTLSAHDEKKTWDPEEKWAKADAEFQKKDAENPPPEGAVVFYGSSSMRMWDVERFFPKRKVINRGFGGSTMPDAVHFAERWVVPLKPSCILVYEGDNDIKNGYSADEVVANYEALIAKFDAALPGTPVIFVPIKPSVSRWTMWPEMLKANMAIKAIADKSEHLYYADIIAPMLEFNGLPKAFLFKSDGLHLNDVGYTIWTDVIDPILKRALDEGK
jgi:lysophospholipase L1-like esterase